MKINIELETNVERTIRVQQLESLFEVPATEKLKVVINGELPIEQRQWQVGAIIGPSGAGKTQILNRYFGGQLSYDWGRSSVIDDFSPRFGIERITGALSAVGFSTIPAWMRPFRCLSNGEQFRANLARHLLEDEPTVVVDEFTSVVDRQVAKIGAYACARYARSQGKRLVVASCHYDIEEWLQPDWTYEPAVDRFTWRVLRRRPTLNCRVARVPYDAWHLFKNFHYMSQELNKAARCYGLWCEDRLAAFTGVLYRPHPKTTNIMGVSRIVCLPDWQGIGIAHALADTVAAAYSSLGFRFRNYPNHPVYIRSYHKKANWMQVKESGMHSPRRGSTSSVGGFGGSRCAVFEYIGPPMSPIEDARALVEAL